MLEQLIKQQSIIWLALEKANLPGVDYYEFKKALDANRNIAGIPENVLYQMTFQAMASSQADVTIQKLLDTGNTYLEVLKKELNDYNGGVDQKKAKEITIFSWFTIYFHYLICWWTLVQSSSFSIQYLGIFYRFIYPSNRQYQ